MTEELEKELERSEVLNQQWEKLKQEHKAVSELLDRLEVDVAEQLKQLSEFKQRHVERLQRLGKTLKILETMASELDAAELRLTTALTDLVKRMQG